MHERVTGLRQTPSLYINVDMTQSIALDEIFGKKLVDYNGNERSTKTYRKSRVTSQVAEIERNSINEGEKTDKMIISEDNDELMVMPVNMTRVKGLCQG
jgi:hypothetical protein